MKKQRSPIADPQRKPAKRKKKNLIFRIVLDIIIVGCLLGAAYLYFEPIYRSYLQDKEEKKHLSEFDSLLSKQSGELLAKVDPNAKPVPGEDYEYYGDDLTIPEPERDEYGNIILRYEGRIIMPRTKITTLLASDDSLYALRYSAGRHNPSPRIEEKGRTVILGHNFHDRGRVFSRLDEVKVGDDIYVDNLKDRKRYIYKVYKFDKIYAEDLLDRVEETSTDNEILLVTCGDEYANGAAIYRMLVYGKLRETIPIPADSHIQ